MSFLYDYIGNLILSLAEIYAWHNIARQKFKLFNIYNFICTIILTLLITINHLYGLNFLKGLIVIIIAFIFCKLIIKYDNRKTIILVFIGEMVIIISEAIIYSILSLGFKYKTDYIMKNITISLIVDFLLAVLVYLISKSKIINAIYNKVLKIVMNIKVKQLFVFLIFIMVGSSIFCTSMYYKSDYRISLVMNILISIIYSAIVLVFIKNQSKYNKVKLKYNLGLENLKAQEKLINDYRILNHENSNNLKTIRAMTKNSKIIKYINSLIKQKNLIKNNIIYDTISLPPTGIRAVIYNKIDIMKQNCVKYNINIDKRINSKVELLLDDDIVDLCQLLSIYIDNAIEETLINNESPINIDFNYDDKSLKISISNQINKNGIVKIDGKMKSSKGKNRGYGLQLAQTIINNNPKISHNLIIYKDVFKQEIAIKL